MALTAGYYHFSSIKSMRLHELRPGYQFIDIKLMDGAKAGTLVAPFKDEYLWVTPEGTGTLVDDEATYRDYMDFSRQAHNAGIC